MFIVVVEQVFKYPIPICLIILSEFQHLAVQPRAFLSERFRGYFKTLARIGLTIRGAPNAISGVSAIFRGLGLRTLPRSPHTPRSAGPLHLWVTLVIADAGIWTVFPRKFPSLLSVFTKLAPRQRDDGKAKRFDHAEDCEPSEPGDQAGQT